MRIKGCLSLLIFTCLSSAIFAQSDDTVEGTVMATDKTALGNATLTIGKATTTSLADGSFSFEGIPSGRHEIEVTALGYETLRETIVKIGSERLSLEIQMTPETNGTFIELGEVTVQAKTVGQQLKEQPIRTVVINTQEVAIQAVSLTDLMNRSTGIRIRQNGGMGSRPEISINGFQGRAIKYFKDGIPLDYLGDGYSISSLPIEALERVEVYKGVLPVSLGADALGGAVNMVTKRNNRTGLNAFYEVGSFNTHRLGAMGTYEGRDHKWFVGTELFFNHSDNDYKANVGVVDPDTRNMEVVRLPMFHNAFDSYYGEIFLGLKNRTWADELRIGLAAFDLEREQQHPALMTDAYGAVHTKQHTVAPTARYKKTFWDGNLSLDQFASYNNLRTQRIDTLRGSYDWYGNFTPGTTLGESRLPSLSDVHEKQFIARTNMVYRISQTGRIGFNYVYTHGKRSGSDPYGPRIQDTDIDVLSLGSTYQKHVFGLSLSDFWWEEKLHNEAMGKLYRYKANGMQNTWFSTDITALDERSQTGSYWGIADALKYQLSPSSLIRTSVEYAYRLPERDELFGNNVFIVPNFELGPERSLNLNLGYQYHLKNTFTLEANGFYRRTKDLILLVPIQAPNAQYQNQENVKGFGFDIDLSYSFLKNYRLSTNASWQNLRLFGITTSQDEWKNDARLRNTPYFFANAGLSADYKAILSKTDGVKLSLNYNFLREFYLETIPKDLEPGGFLGLSGSASLNSNLIIPDQHLLNLGITYQFPSEKISLGIEIRNLMDTEVFDYYRIQRPGRNIALKLSYKLM